MVVNRACKKAFVEWKNSLHLYHLYYRPLFVFAQMGEYMTKNAVGKN